MASFLPKGFSRPRKWEGKPASLLLPLTLSISDEIPSDAAGAAPGFNTQMPLQRLPRGCGGGGMQSIAHLRAQFVIRVDP